MRGLDETDRRIIEFLKEDARRPFVELARMVGLSEAAVRRRIKALVDRGIIRRFTIELSAEEGASAITLVSTEPSIPTPQVAEELRRIEGVEVVYEITGEYDVAVILTAPNIAEINRAVDVIRQVKGVHNTNTIIILRTIR
jgi:DNA-binding Lrp family transcriptional regulator